MGPPGRLDTDFIFQYFKSRYLVFLKDEFYQFHSSWSWDIQRQLFKSFHWTFLCSPLNAMLISEIEPFYDFELKIRFCTFKGLQFTRNFHPWNICVYKDKSSVLNKAHLQLPFLLLLQIIAIFPWLWKQHNTQYLFSQLFCALILTLRSIFHDNAVALWI